MNQQLENLDESTNTEIMELLLMREQYHNFEDSLSNYFNDEKKAPLADFKYHNDYGFAETVAQF